MILRGHPQLDGKFQVSGPLNLVALGAAKGMTGYVIDPAR